MFGVLAIFLGRGAAKVYLGKPTKNAQEIVLEVLPGSSVNTIVDQLVELELLDAPFWFKVYGRLTNQATGLQAGTFAIAPGNSIVRLYRALGDADVAEREVTILEGWTIQDLEDSLVERGIAEPGEVVALANDAAFRSKWPFLSELPATLDIEGYVFPETYRVFADATGEDVLTKALNTFDARIATPKQAAVNATGRNLFDVVTIASIIEREVQRPEDMAMVADLINRRLEIGMPLQMDSTVNYFTGKNDPSITFTDRDRPSPYNTYLNPGLPIGPISNPSEQAIDAVLNPSPNPYLFFLTTPQGEVIYSRTNDEHVRAKNRYLR